MDEKMQILRMVEEGTISVDEASKLLESLGEEKADNDNFNLVEIDKKESGKWLRIRVKDENSKNKVKVNIPVALVDIGLKLAATTNVEFKETLGELDLQSIIQAVKDGAEGKLVDIETEEGEIVEIVVE